MPGDTMQRVRDFLLPAFDTVPPLDFYQLPSSATFTVTTTSTSSHHQPLDLSQYPYRTPRFLGLYHRNHHIPPFLDLRRPQMPRAPHIELRGTQRLSPANPTMAVETRQANMTSPIRPQWDQHSNIKIEDTKTASFSKLEPSSGAFKPIHPKNSQQQTSPSPPPHPKTVSVTVIQPNTSPDYTSATSAISSTVTSSVESCRPSSRSPILERTSGTSELSYGPHPPQFSPYPVDPTYSLHVAVEVHRATQQDADGDTPLHIAISQADELDISLIRHLINLVGMSGRSVDIFNYIQQTPLHVAVITDNADITRLLLEAGANPNETDRNGLTAVHHACVNNSIICLQTILDRSKFTVDMNSRNYNGFAALHATIMDNNMEMTNGLLASGASVEVQDAKNGWSPLFHAVINQNQTMITRLIETGANVNAQSYSGNTALHVATGRGYTDVVRLLMRYGADMSVKNTHRDTPVEVSNNTMISSILQGRGSSYGQERRPTETGIRFRPEPCIRVPTRQPRTRTMTSQHPLSLSESLHPHRLPSATKPGKQSPLPLVKHTRQSTPKRRGRPSRFARSPPVSELVSEDIDKLPSPKKLIIDESQITSDSTKNGISTAHAKSCRVSVIVERQPIIKDNFSSRTFINLDQKPSEKMPLVSQMLLNNGGLKKESVKDNFTLQTLPNSTPTSPRGSLAKHGEQMPILEPVSPMETRQRLTHSSEAPNLSSNVDTCHDSSSSSDPPLSPAIEMSDSEDDEVAVTPPVSPKATPETVTCENNKVNDIMTSPRASPKPLLHEAAFDKTSDNVETRVLMPSASPKAATSQDLNPTVDKQLAVTAPSEAVNGCSEDSSDTRTPPVSPKTPHVQSGFSDGISGQNKGTRAKSPMSLKRSHDSADLREDSGKEERSKRLCKDSN